jgi:hypothetical protein
MLMSAALSALSQVSEARRKTMLYARKFLNFCPLPYQIDIMCGRPESADGYSQGRITIEAGVSMTHRLQLDPRCREER